MHPAFHDNINTEDIKDDICRDLDTFNEVMKTNFEIEDDYYIYAL